VSPHAFLLCMDFYFEAQGPHWHTHTTKQNTYSADDSSLTHSNHQPRPASKARRPLGKLSWSVGSIE